MKETAHLKPCYFHIFDGKQHGCWILVSNFRWGKFVESLDFLIYGWYRELTLYISAMSILPGFHMNLPGAVGHSTHSGFHRESLKRRSQTTAVHTSERKLFLEVPKAIFETVQSPCCNITCETNCQHSSQPVVNIESSKFMTFTSRRQAPASLREAADPILWNNAPSCADLGLKFIRL